MSQGDSLNLAGIFQEVVTSLAENQQTLNQADDANHNHGDNMVSTFQTIARSLQARQGVSDSAALAYAADQLSKNTSSGSGQLYARGLADAAVQFKDKNLDAQSAVQLLQTLIGGGQIPQQAQQPEGGDLLSSLLGGLAEGDQAPEQHQQAGGGDLLSSLLGGLAEGGQAQQTQQPQPSGGDMMGSLLGSLLGAEPAQQQAQPSGGDLLGSLLGASGNQASENADAGLDMKDLINAGLAFMQAKQSGGSNLEALAQAITAASGMGGSAHRNLSTMLVVNTFLKALGSAR